ncbi:hypothetical protein CFRA_01040 [Corynebacterium frankenforstense DSM 45800]|uniref:Uncharacterized protein n=1 Tax=Corynebacterium frankenforstense DSM 45800 TaxID=1437875 RepID=A0A1L7CQI3_9CORY|nr:hypothetical protein [Corynebacterium frankenforstense]APT88106.1 hypothetical protein CFRA_01040 [Corynebacterium frankenforstense DSM 45800]
MNRPLYPLPLVTAGGGARVPVDAASQGVLLSLLGGTDPAGERLHLTRDEYRGGLIVHHGPARIGRLPQAVLDTYPQLGHLLNEGLSPAPGVAVTPEPGSGRLTAELLLPAPGLVMPANSAPDEPWALLPEGSRRAVDTAAGEGTGPLERVVPAQFLAVLRVLDGTVVAAVDGHVVGPLTAADSAAVRDLVGHFAALGLVPVARLYIYDAAPDDVGGDGDGSLADVASGSRSVVVDVRDAASATEADLEPQVNPLPAVPAYRPATGSFPVVGAEAKEWTVTVAGATVTDELPAMTPERISRLREVAPPTMPMPARPTAGAAATDGGAADHAATDHAAADRAVTDGAAASRPGRTAPASPTPAPERAAAMGFPLVTPEQVAADRRSNPAAPADARAQVGSDDPAGYTTSGPAEPGTSPGPAGAAGRANPVVSAGSAGSAGFAGADGHGEYDEPDEYDGPADEYDEYVDYGDDPDYAYSDYDDFDDDARGDHGDHGDHGDYDDYRGSAHSLEAGGHVPAHAAGKKRPALWPGLLAILIGVALVAGGAILGFATTEAVVVAVVGAVLTLLGVAALVRRSRFKMDRR